jgi:hypothetical protein
MASRITTMVESIIAKNLLEGKDCSNCAHAVHSEDGPTECLLGQHCVPTPKEFICENWEEVYAPQYNMISAKVKSDDGTYKTKWIKVRNPNYTK